MKKKINHPHSIWVLALISLGINFLVMLSASQILASEGSGNKNNLNANSNKPTSVLIVTSENPNNSNENNSSDGDLFPITDLSPDFNFDLVNGAIIEGTKNIQGKVEGASA